MWKLAPYQKREETKGHLLEVYTYVHAVGPDTCEHCNDSPNWKRCKLLMVQGYSTSLTPTYRPFYSQLTWKCMKSFPVSLWSISQMYLASGLLGITFSPPIWHLRRVLLEWGKEICLWKPHRGVICTAWWVPHVMTNKSCLPLKAIATLFHSRA